MKPKGEAMFNWFRTHIPAVSQANPGQGHLVRVGFANAQRSGSEAIDLVEKLGAVFKTEGFASQRKAAWLKLANGIWLHPQIVECVPLDKGGVKASTTIEIWHESLIPNGLNSASNSSCFNQQDAAPSAEAGTLLERDLSCMCLQWLAPCAR